MAFCFCGKSSHEGGKFCSAHCYVKTHGHCAAYNCGGDGDEVCVHHNQNVCYFEYFTDNIFFHDFVYVEDLSDSPCHFCGISDDDIFKKEADPHDLCLKDNIKLGNYLKSKDCCDKHCMKCPNPFNPICGPFCKAHCEEEFHSHCAFESCENNSHENSYLCLKHCIIEGHGHCAMENCGGDGDYCEIHQGENEIF